MTPCSPPLSRLSLSLSLSSPSSLSPSSLSLQALSCILFLCEHDQCFFSVLLVSKGLSLSLSLPLSLSLSLMRIEFQFQMAVIDLASFVHYLP